MEKTRRKCEFCRMKQCHLCPATIEKADQSREDKIWHCPCAEQGHQEV